MSESNRIAEEFSSSVYLSSQDNLNDVDIPQDIQDILDRDNKEDIIELLNIQIDLYSDSDPNLSQKIEQIIESL